ncbi:MAG: 4-alpha-glucanotransferase [Oscillospiraceae bacterium]|nr:4-alpha-glucanotransferase [Oscillospiraceae bacterium]
MKIQRSSGILMPIFSLPSPYGIGTLGKAAYEFIDFLAAAGQSWWQILPVGPTSYGDSPYQSFSTFAGNPYFVDPDMLLEDGLLEENDLRDTDRGYTDGYVDYEKLYNSRFDLLRRAAERGAERDREELRAFAEENASWLHDYALFMALKNHFGMKAWTEWEDDGIRLHEPDAVEEWRRRLRADVEFFEYVQLLFFRQWKALRSYASEKGIGIIGDLPIYVALDSADVWANPGHFMLDENNMPTEVAGCPPDYFSEDGQLWGNPLYRWDRMREDGYGWWIRRIDGNAKLYDVLRIDHFRGFESYWAIPADSETAKNGRWVKGPGMDLVGRLTSWFSNVSFIAEDLGFMTPEVRELLRDSGLPGMKVLEFAFDAREPSDYLPHNYTENCVCYVGTHDNSPVMAWLGEAEPEDIAFAGRYLNLSESEGLGWGIIRGGMSSVAALFVAQLQDYLELGEESRINTPGTLGSNWQWRMRKGDITPKLTERIAEITERYGRSNTAGQKRDRNC